MVPGKTGARVRVCWVSEGKVAEVTLNSRGIILWRWPESVYIANMF